DPAVHAALADAYLVRDPTDPRARIEALAARVLAPESAREWVRWGVIQANDGRASQAIHSLEHALALGIEDPARAAMVRQALAELRTMVPGGALVQEHLHR